ncbi:MAG: alginate export family protein [Myxococcota bacterium]|nr:alginate export family protein [Myxococcota bacterium]
MLIPTVISTLVVTSGSAAAAPEVEPHLAVHLRPEVRTNPAFVAGQDDTVVAVQQGVRVGVSGSWDSVSARVDVQEVRTWGERLGSTGTEPAVHAYQGHIEVDTGSGYVRIGRQEIHLHKGYFLSRAPFNPAGRSFDGLRWHQAAGSMATDLFLTQLAASQGWVDGDAPSDLGDWFGGGQVTWKDSDAFRPSVFVFAKAGGATAAEPARTDRWFGPGARATLRMDETLLELDGLVQIGDDSGTPRRAYNVIARAEQGFGMALDPGVAVRFDQSSGHACSGPAGGAACVGDVESAIDLQFGRNFYLRGFANQMSAANTRQMAVEGFVRPSETTRVELIGSWFQMTDPEGAWIGPGGTLQGAGWKPGNADPNLGWELDGRVIWKASKALQLAGGLAWFQPVGVGAELTGTDAQSYTWLQTRFTL